MTDTAAGISGTSAGVSSTPDGVLGTPPGVLSTGAPIDLGGGAQALFTDRSHGNLSSVGGTGCERGLQARERLRARHDLSALARGYQVHGSHVAMFQAGDPRELSDSAEQPTQEADGQAVAVPGVAAMVLAADCVPVVLAADGAVAALHAGWRGLVAGVLEQGVRALRDVGGSGEVVAVVGPCAGVCCYEVGEEVQAAVACASGPPGEREGDPEREPPGPAPEADVGKRARIDLRAIVHRRLESAGVVAVADVAACTICDERFFSHRREGAAAGRQAGLAWLV
ncbi:MAG TPA: polyphenol oxidase family protein [Solirubrobacteraceae bacterium]|nr:polyphenol oxidase family protein [Solirubrobacteraceae bacterium]